MIYDTSAVKIAVIGDFCLDVYWYADMTKSELSRETPHFPLPVVKEKMSPGGAGNVAANVSALGVSKVYAVGVVGDDWRGECLKKALESNGVSSEMLVCSEGRFTNTYIKPHKAGLAGKFHESERIDFEAREPLDEKSEGILLSLIDRVADIADVICVCDQMNFGCITEKVRMKLCELGANGKIIIVDSRDSISSYRNVTVKPNDIEASRATGISDPVECAVELCKVTSKPAIVTCGDKGCIVCDGENVSKISAFKAEGEIDICGAGDTFLSALAVFTACGASLCDAAKYANAASCVTVKKVGTTGTASLSEIENVLKS
jgi:rfaE bifunctional protein kinase chain/domain